MRVTVVLLALILTCPAARAGQTELLRLDFDSPEQFAALSDGPGRLTEGHAGTPSLLIEKGREAGSAVRRLPLPAERMAGRLLTVSARVRAEDVSERPRPWNGIKVMLVLEVGGGREYPQLPLRTGTFDWMRTQRAIRIPSDTTGATLVLGLEQVSGRVWFDDVVIQRGRPGGMGKRQETRFRGHGLSRLRGVMHGPATNEENVRVLAEEWGANLVRLQINWTPMKKAEVWARDLDAYDEWLDGILPEIDRGVDLCEQYGLLVALDLHTPPGGRVEGGVCPLFTDPVCQEKLVEVWQRLARRYRGRDHIWAYDLLNEPVQPPPGPGVVSWKDLFTRVARAIREIEPGKPVIFEPGPWGSCEGFDSIVPLDLDRVIYSFHMYVPGRFTHQTIHGNPGGVRYPGEVDGRFWDMEALRRAMRPAIDFQKEFNVHMYVGEFSAIRWAPGDSARNYLRDCIELFEQYGWDWSYHAYREWQGWSVEHGPDREDREPVAEPTPRKRLLLKWFARNERPPA